MHSWKGNFANFARPYFAPYEITKRTKLADAKVLSEELSLSSCPLGHQYDPDLHDAIAHLRILDGSLPEHPKPARGTRPRKLTSKMGKLAKMRPNLAYRYGIRMPTSTANIRYQTSTEYL